MSKKTNCGICWIGSSLKFDLLRSRCQRILALIPGHCDISFKYLHGLETIAGRGFIFEGTRHQSCMVDYARKENCPAHDADLPVETISWCVSSTQVGALLDWVRADLGPEAVIETGRDLLASLYCPGCRQDEAILASLGKVTVAQGRCPHCGGPRTPAFYHTIDAGRPALLDLTLAELGIPPWDVLGGRAGLDQRFYEFGGDRVLVLGALEQGDDSIVTQGLKS
jgi:hypothetical protein